MIKSTDNAEHYTWGSNCDGWHLLKTDNLSVIEEKMPAGTFEKLHYHNKAQQLFYILKGVATFEIEGEEVVIKANESVHIKAGAKHKISNKENEDLKFLVISQPRSHGDRVELEYYLLYSPFTYYTTNSYYIVDVKNLYG